MRWFEDIFAFQTTPTVLGGEGTFQFQTIECVHIHKNTVFTQIKRATIWWLYQPDVLSFILMGLAYVGVCKSPQLVGHVRYIM